MRQRCDVLWYRGGMSIEGMVWAIIGAIAIGAIAMQVPAWLLDRSERKADRPSAEHRPMSVANKALMRNAAWLLCAALLGGLAGAAIVTRGPASTSLRHEEPEVDASDVGRLEDEISRLKSRVGDLEDKAR